MITFNTAYRNDDKDIFTTVHSWLGALYTGQDNEIKGPYFFRSLNTLQTNLDYQFNNQAIFITALTHKTFHFENKKWVDEHNEKLEFLGDAVLGHIVARFLYLNYPQLNEGELSKLRVSLVNEASFARLGRAINLSENLFIGKGEFKNNGHLKDVIVADAFEALFGALSLELDLEKIMKVFQTIVVHYEKSSNLPFIDIEAIETFDSKSKLQELSMKKLGVVPQYISREINGEFEVALMIGDKNYKSLIGTSKKKLEKELAKFVIDNNLL
jgi:ribonuclease-3